MAKTKKQPDTAPQPPAPFKLETEETLVNGVPYISPGLVDEGEPATDDELAALDASIDDEPADDEGTGSRFTPYELAVMLMIPERRILAGDLSNLELSRIADLQA